MKRIRLLVLVMMALTMTACVNVQCAAGSRISQHYEPDPLIGMAVVFVAGALFVLALCALAGSSGGLGGGE